MMSRQQLLELPGRSDPTVEVCEQSGSAGQLHMTHVRHEPHYTILHNLATMLSDQYTE